MIRMKSIPRILTLATTILFSVVSQAQIIYVSIEGGGDGSSWERTTTLSKALNRARAGEQIWVRGYENANEKQMYIPDSKDGFKLKSGVQLYGGFAGKETSIDERETLDFPYRLKYRSILSGDIAKNDTLDAVNLIFPGNGTRDDNATHVLSIDMNPSSSSGNNNSYPTVVNGFTVTGGHAAAAAMDPTETYFVATTRTAKIAISSKAPTGPNVENRQPTATAMPLPPLKPSQGQKIWPMVQPRNATARQTCSI